MLMKRSVLNGASDCGGIIVCLRDALAAMITAFLPPPPLTLACAVSHFGVRTHSLLQSPKPALSGIQVGTQSFTTHLLLCGPCLSLFSWPPLFVALLSPPTAAASAPKCDLTCRSRTPGLSPALAHYVCLGHFPSHLPVPSFPRTASTASLFCLWGWRDHTFPSLRLSEGEGQREGGGLSGTLGPRKRIFTFSLYPKSQVCCLTSCWGRGDKEEVRFLP